MDIERVKQLQLHSDEGDVPPSKQASGFKRSALTLLFAISAFAAGWLLRPMPTPSIVGGGPTGAAVTDQPGGDTLPVMPSTAGRNFTATGYIEPMPPYPVKVTPLVSGRLELFEVLEGMPVAKDQVIARLDNSAMERRVEELQAALSVHAARIKHALSIATRTERLSEIGSVSRRELEQAQAELATLEAEAKQAGEEMTSVKWQIENTDIVAPVAGVVYERMAQSGQWVGPGHESAIASIYDPARLQVWVDVNQRDAGRVHVGQRVEVSLDAEPGRNFKGHVARILPRASIAKNTFQAKIELMEVSDNVRPDMSVRVSFLNEAESHSVQPRLSP